MTAPVECPLGVIKQKQQENQQHLPFHTHPRDSCGITDMIGVLVYVYAVMRKSPQRHRSAGLRMTERDI